MTAEVLEKLRLAIESATEAVDALQESINEAASVSKQLSLPLPAPTFDNRIRTDEDAMGMYAYKVLPGGYKLMVDIADVAYLTRPMQVTFGLMADGSIRPALVQTTSRVADTFATPGNKVSLGRLIIRPGDGMDCDHIDRNPFNCRRYNLREATRSENNKNKGAPAVPEQLELALK